MAHQTAIEWTNTYLPEGMLVNWKGQLVNCIPGATFNPWWGCEKVSPACKNCYAEEWDHRFSGGESHWGPKSQRRKFGDKHWNEPLKWNKECEKLGIRRKVFCASMADVFEDHPDVKEERKRLWKLIEDTPHLDWLLLTKRPENILKTLPSRWLDITYDWKAENDGAITNPRNNSIPKNIWFGTTVESEEYKSRVRELIKVKASTGRIIFLSMEPLFGFVDLEEYYFSERLIRNVPEGSRTKLINFIDWIIVGGESGDKARLGRYEWFTFLRDQCKRANVPFFFKQWGNIARIDQFPNEGSKPTEVIQVDEGQGLIFSKRTYFRVRDKHIAGRKLDGVEYSEMPTV